MNDWEEKLNAILSNPEAMGQIMNLAQSLNPGGPSEGTPQDGGTAGQAPPAEDAPEDAGADGPGGLGGLAGLGSLLGQIDPKWIQRLLPLAGELAGNGNDERMQLLYALRPFLRPERQEKVEQAAKTARLLHIGKKLLKSMGDQNV